ncbi:MAG: phosphoenolpyruvate--protein phosphotransferase [Oscillospiraceae bacterium]|jgi:phosphotransferase system enzyme I (PtsI)|nr:phosphoenolpyruvate--protein phosphotransferase [Oscillospiraceae bacterium]
MILRGIGASGGTGMGPAVCLQATALNYTGRRYAGVGDERARLRAAVCQVERDTAALAGQMRSRTKGSESVILTGQITMLQDPELEFQLDHAIQEGETAEAAVDAVLGGYVRLFQELEDERMRLRAADIQDLQGRLIRALLGLHEMDLSQLPAGCILVTRELTPSMTVGLDRERVAGILTETGGSTSHAAILARALGIPAVLGASGVLQVVENGDLVLVDGDKGNAILHPSQEAQKLYRARRALLLQHQACLEPYRHRPTLDGDGRRCRLYANVGHPTEAARAAGEGAEGIGLLRTEFLFLDRAIPPTEEEQMAAYLAAARPFPGGEVVIRTLDVGGDKQIPWLALPQEPNPFLGCRGLRTSFARPELFRVQLRALLRAGAEVPGLRVLLPMVTDVSEVRQVRKMLSQCEEELEQEGLAFRPELPLGVMVETPAAARTADLLARESDFFSIGTNDLTQYILAADRNSPEVNKLYTSLHPAVLRELRDVIRAGRQAGIPVELCGEAAAGPEFLPLLLAWGLEVFSVSPAMLLETRARIAGWTAEKAADVERQVMALAGVEEIRAYYHDWTYQ